MAKIEINPCPKCGGKKTYFVRAMSEYRVCCDNDDCRMLGPWAQTRSKAVRAWNDEGNITIFTEQEGAEDGRR